MADKKPKTQAERAASAAKTKSTGKKGNDGAKKNSAQNVPEKQGMPVRVISSLVFLGLFVLFLVTFSLLYYIIAFELKGDDRYGR